MQLAGIVQEKLMATRATKKSSTTTKPANALQKPLKPSPELAAVVGAEPLSRADAVKRVWDYIKVHKRQNPENGREILADEKLKKVFGGEAKVTMFELNKHLSQHLN
jgi:upstream activation factor subunit UAF30